MAKLSSATKMLNEAKKGKYAIAHINTNNLEWTKAILTVAQETKTPVIIGVSEGAAKYQCGFKNIADMVKNMMDHLKITVPIAVHLDHGSYEGAKAALKAGFSSVMFDGSHYPFAENLKKTKEIVALAKKQGASIEAEVGTLGGEEDGVVGTGEFADPKECAQISKTGITMLAAGIGNIHGQYPKNWPGLSLDTLEKVEKVVDGLPLVLHGGTGIPLDQIKRAIELGVAKINVNTELQLAFAQATRGYIKAKLDKKGKGFDPRKLLNPGFEAIKNVIKEKFEVFGSLGKA